MFVAFIHNGWSVSESDVEPAPESYPDPTFKSSQKSMLIERQSMTLGQC